MDLVEPLDHALHQRRLNSPPDRRREDDDLRGQNFLQDSRPLIARPHVALRAWRNLAVDESNHLAAHTVVTQTLDHHLAQRFSVREFLAGSFVFECGEKNDCL